MYVVDTTRSVSVWLMVHIVCSIPLGPVCLAFHLGPVGVSLSLWPFESARLDMCISGGRFLVQFAPLTSSLVVYAASSSPLMFHSSRTHRYCIPSEYVGIKETHCVH